MTIEKSTATGEQHCIDFEEFKPEIEKRAKAIPDSIFSLPGLF